MEAGDDDLDGLYREAEEILGQVDGYGGPNLGSPVTEAPMWNPPQGWGTVRDYVVVRNERGGTDVGCRFIPDDGSRGIPLIWRDVTADSVPLKGLGEYARGIIVGEGDDRSLNIKITPDGMARAEKLVAEINAMESVRRAIMQKNSQGFYETCGYGRDSSWRLVNAAPWAGAQVGALSSPERRERTAGPR
jgi:hypothetical protein